MLGAMEAILPTTAPDAVDDAAAAGFDGLELDVAGPDPGDDPVWTPAGRTRIRRRAAERGIDVPSICLGFLNRGGLADDDPDVRADARAAVVRGIDAAAALGAGAVLVPFFGAAAVGTDRERDRLVDGVAAVADAAAAAGITLAIENTLSGETNAALLDRIDSPAVGVYYDVGNAIAYGNDPVADLRALGEDVARVHFKDWSGDEPRAIGDGDVDFPACVEALRAIGYDGWIVLETTAGEQSVADAERNLERSRRLLGAR